MFDKLVASGRLFYRSIKVAKGTFGKNHNSGTIPSKPKSTSKPSSEPPTYDTYLLKSNQGEKLFEFLCKNTNVEWSHWKLGTGLLQMSLISTSHYSNTDMSSEVLTKNPYFVMSITGHDHYHPGGDKRPSGSNIPTDIPNGRIADVAFAKEIELYQENFIHDFNEINSQLGGEKLSLNKPIFRIYTSNDNQYTIYNGDTYIKSEATVRPK
jgi:hypothetical protein